MKEIAVPLSEVETHVLCGVLAAANIPARVRMNPWFVPGMEPNGLSSTRIVVDERDFAGAERIVAEYLTQRAKRSVAYDELRGARPTWACWQCGEDVETQFAVCWNCSTERPNDWI